MPNYTIVFNGEKKTDGKQTQVDLPILVNQEEEQKRLSCENLDERETTLTLYKAELRPVLDGLLTLQFNVDIVPITVEINLPQSPHLQILGKNELFGHDNSLLWSTLVQLIAELKDEYFFLKEEFTDDRLRPVFPIIYQYMGNCFFTPTLTPSTESDAPKSESDAPKKENYYIKLLK